MIDLDISKVVRVASHHREPCPDCNELVGDFEDLCNHLMKNHGMQLLHIGQEGSSDGTRAFFETVAFFGEQAPK
jgi:hypothetical protein